MIKKTIISNKNNKIFLKLDDGCIYATDITNHIIGEFLYRTIEQGDDHMYQPDVHKLYSMNINPPYQGEGIGTEMIRFFEENCNTAYPSAFDVSSKYNDEYFTDEGLQLVQHCIDLGIIESSKIYPTNEDDEY